MMEEDKGWLPNTPVAMEHDRTEQNYRIEQYP